MLLDELLETFCDTVTHFTCNLASVSLFDFFKSVVTGNAAKGVSSHGSANESLLCLGALKTCTEELHVLSLTAESASSGISASDNLTEYCKVRRNSEVTLST